VEIFPEEEIQWWFVSFTNDNEDQSSTVHQQQAMLKRIEDDSFEIKVKKDITVALLHEHIQEWLNRVLKGIINPP
jgi:hypothetical protein